MHGYVRVALCFAASLNLTVRDRQVSRTDTASLCNQGRTVCVSDSLSNSLIANPISVDVQLTAPDWMMLKWSLTDSAGTVLGESQEGEYYRDSAKGQPATVRVRNFIFKPATSTQGTLTFTPVKEAANDFVDAPGLRVPVRLTTQTTVVTIFEPESQEAMFEAVDKWFSKQHREDEPIDLPLKTSARRQTIMKVPSDLLLEATIEAAFAAHPGQAPQHVARCRQIGSTVHVHIVGETWAGSSVFFTGIDYLVRKSLLNLPGIRGVVFE
jgi:hypothetical protein